MVRATAGDGWAGNYSSGYSTVEAAKEAALAGCKDYAKTLYRLEELRATNWPYCQHGGRYSRRFDRAFKLAALERMAAAANEDAPDRELAAG